MIQLGEVVMILEWDRQGMSVSAIARQSGLDRTSKVLAGETPIPPPFGGRGG